MPAELSILMPDGKTQTTRLDQGRYTLGRALNNEWCFPDDGGLSRQHLAVEQEADGWVVADLGSKNGTLLNGQRLASRQRLQPGDTVTASTVVLTFVETVSATLPLATLDAVPVAYTLAAPAAPAPLPPPLPVAEAPPPAVPDWALRTSLQEALVSAVHATPVPTPGRALDPMAALVRAGREFAAMRPLQELFSAILDLSIEAAGAERGLLLTLEEDGLVTQASRGAGLTLSSGVAETVLREKTSLLVADVRQNLNLRDRASIVMQQVRTLMAVPLQTDERVIGLLYLDSPFAQRNWGTDDLNLLTVMANVAAIRLERERLAAQEEARRLMAAELHQAAEIQCRFLPCAAPVVPGWELVGHNAPSRTVGGDYYDFLPCPGGQTSVLVADVAGKGMPAALLMMGLQARAQVLAETTTQPGEFVTRLNRLVAANCPENRFITLFFCMLGPAPGQIRFANAGHNPPLIMRNNGVVEELRGGGPVMGILKSLSFDTHECRLEPGDWLALYSDGVTEACNSENEEFGEERLGAVLRRYRTLDPDNFLAAVLQEIRGWTGGAAPSDDVTLVLVRCRQA